MRPYGFGIDIGGTAIKLGLFDTEGELLEKWQIPTRRKDLGKWVLPDALDSVRAKMAERGIGWDQVEGVGMGVPGPVTEDGTVLRCINLGWDVFNIPNAVKKLEPQIENFQVSNDVNAAALGEIWQGGARGRWSAVMVTLGTGIGGGIVVGHKMIYGSGGAGGEIGHICIEPDEPVRCKCGGRGCLEQYCSATGLLRVTRQHLHDHPGTQTVLSDTPELTAKDICDAAREGDPFALSQLDLLGKRLGRALTAVAATIDPQIFVIGGGLSNAGQILLDPIEAYYRKYAFHAFRHTEFALAELGNDAGIYGCVKMILS